MKSFGELLQDADPLQHEPALSPGERNFRRKAVLAAASGGAPPGVRPKPRTAVFAILALTAIAASLFGSRVWSLFVGDLQAAVRFEVRLAEDKPAPGLHEAKLSGSGRLVYLHPEIIVTNSDIVAARAVPDGGPEQYSINVEFNASGAEKMRAATGNHIGKPVAILLDGQVVMAPVLRSPISASARITGKFTRAQAEKIVHGIELQ